MMSEPNDLYAPASPRLVLLDRDGVINQDRAEGILHPRDFHFLPRAVEAIAMLTRAQVRTAICSNQSAIGRGILSFAEFDAIHHLMLEDVRRAGGHIDRIYVAPDPPDAATDRRKPGPGMLLEALRDFKARAQDTFFVGDMLRDAQAAQKAGCPFILVRTGKGERTLAEGIPEIFTPYQICADLFEAAEYILSMGVSRRDI